MPRSAPPAEVPPPRTPARSALERAARERARDARACAALEAQLGALDRDIRWVRRTARQAAAATGARACPPTTSTRRPGHAASASACATERRSSSGRSSRRTRRSSRLGFEHLSAVSRYRRFLARVDDLSPHQLSYLTHVDHLDHEAIAALDAVTGDGIGIARYRPRPRRRAQAEVAIVVVDAWQGRGVGTALMERLGARPRPAGVERITARMLVGNDAARALIAHAADILSEQRRSGTVVLEAKLKRPHSSPC